MDKKEGVIGLFRGKELRCSRTCQGPGSFRISGELVTASGTIVGPIAGLAPADQYREPAGYVRV